MPEFNPGDYVTADHASYARVEAVTSDDYVLRPVLILHPDEVTLLADDTIPVPHDHPLTLVLRAEEVQRTARILGQPGLHPAPPPFTTASRTLN